jgi:hypothetical protein
VFFTHSALNKKCIPIVNKTSKKPKNLQAAFPTNALLYAAQAPWKTALFPNIMVMQFKPCPGPATKKQTNAVTGVHTSSNAFGHFPETFFVSPADFHRQNTFSSVCCLEKIKLLSCLTHSVFSHLCR